MFEWDDARHFLAIQRTRSLSEAGRRLGVNQSTVGRRLRALEASLGAVLFVHTPDGYVLSPAGERLLPRAEHMENAAFALEREATGRQEALTGVIRVTGPDAFTARVVIPILSELHRRTPGIDYEIVAENRTLSLSKREADMAVRTFRPVEPQLVSRRICDFGSALYASRDYVEAYGKPKGGDYTGHAFVSVDDASWGEAIWLRRACPNARVVLKTNSTPTQIAATRAGMGIGMLPCYVGDADPELVRLSSERIIVRQVWIALHRDLQHAGRIRACADALAEGIAARGKEIAGEITRARRGPGGR